MTTKTKTRTSMATRIISPQPSEIPSGFDDEDRSDERAVEVIPQGTSTLSAVAEDPNAEPTQLDPGGDIQHDFRSECVGRELVITRWSLSPASEQYANANPYGLFAVLGFRFADDAERKPRFTTTGATRIVEAVQQAILNGQKLPVRTTVVAFRTRGGEGYRFLRPGEAIR